MNEIQSRINSVTHILASNASKADKVVGISKALSGLDITGLSNQKTECVYKHIITCNQIISRYPAIKNYDDYKIISDVDLNKFLKSTQQLCLKLLLD